MASIRVAKAIQRIKEEIVAGLKVWVEEWDPEVANPPIDLKTGLPILDEIPSRTPGRPTFGDFIATFDPEDAEGFEDLWFGEPAVVKRTLLKTPLTDIFEYPAPEHHELHTDVSGYDESK